MRVYSLVLSPVVILLSAATLQAQAPAVVQLPSYSLFGVATTVSVPDRGTMSLGGVGRSSSGSAAFGPALGPGNRAFGRSTSATSATVHATIHDFDALDRATLARASHRPRGASSGDPRRRSMYMRFSAPQSTASIGPQGSVVDARRLRQADVANKDREARGELAHARWAAEQGKPAVAKVYYRIAARRASGALKETIEREAARLAAAPAPCRSHRD